MCGSAGLCVHVRADAFLHIVSDQQMTNRNVYNAEVYREINRMYDCVYLHLCGNVLSKENFTPVAS